MLRHTQVFVLVHSLLLANLETLSLLGEHLVILSRHICTICQYDEKEGILLIEVSLSDELVNSKRRELWWDGGGVEE